MRQQSPLRFLEERKVGVIIVLSTKLRTVGWAIRAFTPVFDGLWALALPSLRRKDFRAPCPPSASMQDAPPLVGTAHAKPFVVEKQCQRLCPPYGACIFLAAVLLLTTPARADDVADFYRGKTVTITVSAGAGGG